MANLTVSKRRKTQPRQRSASFLYIELGSVSFKASYFPKGANNNILADKGSEVKRYRNLLCLQVYRNQPVRREDLDEVVAWFHEIYDWVKKDAVPPADEVLVVATAAFRDMEFFEKLEKAVENILATRVITIGGFLEAQLLMESYRRTPQQFPGSPTVLFDLGGGSLEIVWIEKGSRYFTSLDLGSGRVTAWFMDGLSRKEITERIYGEFKENCRLIKVHSPGIWYGTGGAVKSFKNAFKKSKHDPIFRHHIKDEYDRVSAELLNSHGRLKREAIDSGFDKLIKAAPKNLDEHRKSIYLGGLQIIEDMCEYFDINSIVLDKASVRGGVVSRLLLLRSSPLP
ncbi:MAG: hypothetical protein HY717_01070 [Planctomycetes bacterium]|nr:hypothetical protein [Planctomycetota bacterium]